MMYTFLAEMFGIKIVFDEHFRAYDKKNDLQASADFSKQHTSCSRKVKFLLIVIKAIS